MMNLTQNKSLFKTLGVTVSALVLSINAYAAHPNLVITNDDVQQMRQAISNNEQGKFANAFAALKAQVDEQIKSPITVGEGIPTNDTKKIISLCITPVLFIS